MDFPRNADDVDDLMSSFNTLVDEIAEARTKVAALTATASELEGRVRVTVNARGVVIETFLDDDVAEQVPTPRLASAITAAAQSAAAQVGTEAARIWDPINERRGGLPRASDVLAGIPKFDELLGSAPEPPLTVEHKNPTDSPGDLSTYEDVELPESADSSFNQRAW